MVDLLLAHGAAVEARTEDGETPLMVAVTNERGYHPDFIERYVAEVERYGGLVHFSADLIETVIGKQGAARAESGTFEQHRLSEMLHEAESNADYLLFEVTDGRLRWRHLQETWVPESVLATGGPFSAG